ncbi:glycosyltransferase [Streptomyces sp. MK5]|uniref:glycosyltransferase n=1 Tax=Streptomyces sp. MK5 TaxID=3064253 RepID=UPI0027414B99|nr:glycosyltransferase [Streptomyces sp. MK5]
MSRQLSSPRTVRVLHVLNELQASGAEVMLRSAAAHWKDHGVESHVLAVAPAIGPYAQDLRSVGYRVTHQPDIPLRRVPRQLMQRVRAAAYDVVHLHAERGNFWFALAALGGGAKVVRTVHSVFPFCGRLRAERWVQRRTLGALGVAHVAISTSVADNEMSRFGNATHIVDNWYGSEFVPPGHRERSNARRALGLGEHDLVAVSVGNCSSIKRHPLLLEAMAHPESPDSLVYLHVGREDETRSERRLADHLRVTDRTRFLGAGHPLKALHAADMFVMPSSHEGLGIAAIEALATGLPAIVTDVPGLRDLVTASPAVMLTDATPEAFARAMAATVPIVARDQRVQQTAPAIHDRFGMARGVARYSRIYRGLLVSRRRR